jgi:hypothetical protein
MPAVCQARAAVCGYKGQSTSTSTMMMAITSAAMAMVLVSILVSFVLVSQSGRQPTGLAGTVPG